MTLADTQQQRLLERPREPGEQPVGFAELYVSGIDFPVAGVSELELSGYAIERVHDYGRLIGVRLLGPKLFEAPAAHPRRRPFLAASIATGRRRRDSRKSHRLRVRCVQSRKRANSRYLWACDVRQ
jgi:hypothetical protein